MYQTVLVPYEVLGRLKGKNVKVQEVEKWASKLHQLMDDAARETEEIHPILGKLEVRIIRNVIAHGRLRRLERTDILP